MKFDLATLDLADGTHTVKVKAKASGYIDSEFSNEVSYTKAPAAPTITLTGSIISWAAVTGATGYRIIATADVAKQTDTTSTSFDLSTWSDLTAGTWTVQVLSTNGTVYSDSSNTVTYTVQNKLATPTIAIDGNTLKITDVENAQRYKIYANGELKTTITKAVQGFTLTLNVSYSTSSEPNKQDRVKIGSAPTSDDDYDYRAGWDAILNKAGTALGGTVTVNNVFKYYTWTTWSNGTTDWQTAAEHTEHSYTLVFTMTCLTGDTLITMSDGSEKRIDTIKVGDKVLSYNPETGNLEEDEVTYSDSTENKQHNNFDVWTFGDGTIIKTVHRHRFYNIERNAMVYMDEWKIGEHGRRKDGVLVTLVSHENVKETINHYTIFTKNQNYFANGLLSGNRYTKHINF